MLMTMMEKGTSALWNEGEVQGNLVEAVVQLAAATAVYTSFGTGVAAAAGRQCKPKVMSGRREESVSRSHLS